MARSTSIAANFEHSAAAPGIDSGNRLLRGAINGWTASGIMQILSGVNLQGATGTIDTEFGMAMPAGTPTQIRITGRPDVAVAPVLTCDPRKNLAPSQYPNPSCFTLPTSATTARSSFRNSSAPASSNTDLSLFKRFKFTERCNSLLNSTFRKTEKNYEDLLACGCVPGRLV